MTKTTVDRLEIDLSNAHEYEQYPSKDLIEVIEKDLVGIFSAQKLYEFTLNVRIEGWAFKYPDVVLEASASNILFTKRIAGAYLSCANDLVMLRVMICELAKDACEWREASSPSTPKWRLNELMLREAGKFGAALNPNIDDCQITTILKGQNEELIKLLYDNPAIDKKQKMIIEIQTGVRRG